MPANMRDNFLSVISRVRVGTLCLSTACIGALKLAGFIAGKYSLSRTVTGKDGAPVPIINFRTQQRPVLHVLAQTAVFDAYARNTILRFLDVSLDKRVRDGHATAFKIVLIQATQSGLYELTERCGAQGLFNYNQMIQLQIDMRGVSIAEGDSLVLCISRYHFILGFHIAYPLGLASELLIGRYKMPPPNFPSYLLAKHEAGLFREACDIMNGFSGGHRSDDFNRQILPLCQPLIEAVGHRLAYEAALEAHVDRKLLDLYEIGAIRKDASWYVEHAGLSRRSQMQMEDTALSEMPELSKLLYGTGAEPYCSAPIVSGKAWNEFVSRLPKYGSFGDMVKASI
jgi:acyl-CoA oxidase